jgi:MFS family permease
VFFAALAQAAAMSGFGVVVAALAIAAERVTGSKALGTFALALEFAARACAAVPAARAAARRGRRPVLLLGSLCGSLGSLLVAADLTIKSYVVGVVGVVAIGVANAVAQQARFVAAEAVSASDKKRALAVCVAGGAVAAFAGPELAKVSRTWLSNAEYGGCFVAMAACYFFFGVFVVFCRSAGTVNDVFVNAPGESVSTGDGLAWKDVFRTLLSSSSPNARKGTACVASAWPLMFLIMSAAPLAMTGEKEGGLGFDDAADAIQLHLLAMFAPGVVGTGDLVNRIGPDNVAHIGCALFVATAVFANAFVPESDVIPYAAFRDGLVILGVAWHLVFVAGSAMLSDEGLQIQGACESLAFFN